MYRTTYEKYCIEMIELFLNSENFEDFVAHRAVKASIKDLTRHYPEVTVEGTTAYTASTIKKIQMITKYHRISSRAAKIIDELVIDKDTKLNKLIHFEHIIPNEVIYKEILILKKNNTCVSKHMIKEVIDQSEVIIISKEEKDVIDGKKGTVVLLEGVQVKCVGLSKSGTMAERLAAINATFDPRYVNNRHYL